MVLGVGEGSNLPLCKQRGLGAHHSHVTYKSEALWGFLSSYGQRFHCA